MSGWSEPVEIPSANLGIDPMVDTNFAPVILANGSLVGAFRGVPCPFVLFHQKFQLLMISVDQLTVTVLPIRSNVQMFLSSGVTRTGSITFASDWKEPSTYKCIVKDPKFEDFGEDPK